MTNWQIYHLLASILGGKNLQDHVDRLNNSDCWTEIIELSSHQMVTTQLAVILKNDPDAWSKVQPEEATYLDEIVSLNIERNRQIINQTNELILALNETGIFPLIMKGTASLLTLKELNIGYRMQVDIDILAQPKDMQQAIQTLRDLGYQYSKESNKGLQAVSTQQEKSVLRSYKHHKHLPPLIKEGERTAVELHRHLYSMRYQKYYDVNRIFQRSKLITNNKYRWHQLNHEDERQLLLTGGYIDPRLRQAFNLPLRLVRDYLDIQPRSGDEVSDNGESLNKTVLAPLPSSIIKAQKEVEQLILLLSGHWSSAYPIDSRVSKYLSQLESMTDRPSAHRRAHNRATFFRKLINFTHNPRLLLKRLS